LAPPLGDEDKQDKHLHAPVLRRVLHMPILHVSPKGSVGGGMRAWAWVPPLEDGDGQDKHLNAPIIILAGKPAVDLVATDTHTKASWAIETTALCTRICPYPFIEVKPPGAAPGPPVTTPPDTTNTGPGFNRGSGGGAGV